MDTNGYGKSLEPRLLRSGALVVLSARKKGEVATPFVSGISTNGRHFVDQSGAPILVKGDTPWSAFADLDLAGWQEYLTARRGQGFNVCMLDLVSTTSVGGPDVAGKDYLGNSPFVGGDVSVLNEAYWTRVDAMIDEATSQGMSLMVNPLDWYALTDTGGAFNGQSTAKLQSYGALVGARYGSKPSVTWVLGNDYQDWPAQDAKFDACLDGIQSATSTPVVSMQLDYHVSYTTDSAHWASRSTWNFIYSYTAPYDACKDGWDAAAGPALYGEGAYIGEAYTGGNVQSNVRRQTGWALTSGSPGDIMGTEDYGFPSGWQSRLSRSEVLEVKAMRDVFEAVDWWTLVPVTNLLTAGAGTRLSAIEQSQPTDSAWPAQTDYASGAVSADGRLAMVYLPTQRAITVNTALLGTSPSGTWISAATGAETAAGSLAGAITPPASGDWILRIAAS